MSDVDLWPVMKKTAENIIEAVAQCPLSRIDKARLMVQLSSYLIENAVMAIEAAREHHWSDKNPAPKDVRSAVRRELFEEIMSWDKKGHANFSFIRKARSKIIHDFSYSDGLHDFASCGETRGRMSMNRDGVDCPNCLAIRPVQ